MRRPVCCPWVQMPHGGGSEKKPVSTTYRVFEPMPGEPWLELLDMGVADQQEAQEGDERPPEKLELEDRVHAQLRYLPLGRENTSVARIFPFRATAAFNERWSFVDRSGSGIPRVHGVSRFVR